MLHRVINRLASLRVTSSLLLILAVLFLLGLWIPQRGLFDQKTYQQWLISAPLIAPFLDRIGFTRIYSSPFTLAVWFLFFFNLSLVMWKRVPLIKKRLTLGEDNLVSPRSPQFSTHRVLELGESGEAVRIMELLKREGFVLHGTERHFCGVKNRYSALANLVFHLSFFLILAGGVIDIYTGFRGIVVLAEGESFNGELDRYKQPVKLPLMGEAPAVAFSVERIVPEISGDTATQLTVKIAAPGGKRHNIQINRPFSDSPVSYVLKNLGIAPLFVLSDQDGKELDGAYIRLDVLKGKEDFFNFGGHRFVAHFYSDYVSDGDTESSRSLEFRNPVLRLTEMDGSRKVSSRTVRLGEGFTIGGRTIRFAEMPFWVSIQVVKEPGSGIIFFGAFLASFALAWRLLLYRRDIVCSLEEQDGRTVLLVGWRTEFYRALAEEDLEKLMVKLAKCEGNG